MLVLLGLLVLVAVICAIGGGPLVPHAEASDECCGFGYCSPATVGRAGIAPWVVAVTLGLGGVAAAHSTWPGPTSPPPEILSPRSA